MGHWSKQLPEYTFTESKEWYLTKSSPEKAWKDCDRADWMFWLLGYCYSRDEDKRRQVAVCLCHCVFPAVLTARTEPNKTYSKSCIAAVDAWSKGLTDLQYVTTAYRKVRVIDIASFSAYAASLFDLIPNPESACDWASTAAEYAAKALAYDMRDKSTDNMLRTFAHIVRRYFPSPPLLQTTTENEVST